MPNPELTPAEQLRQMREALKGAEALVFAWMTVYQFNQQLAKPHQTHEAIYNNLKAALALTPSQAEQQVRENAEKAALLDWMVDGMVDLYVEDRETVGDPSCEPHPYLVLAYRLPDKYMAAECAEEHPFFDEPEQPGKRKLLDALRAAKEAL